MGSPRTLGLAILVALPGWLIRPYLGMVTSASLSVGRGAEAFCWQCFSDGGGQGGVEYMDGYW